MATNHDGHKVYRDGHSNENVKNPPHTFKKLTKSQHRLTNFTKLRLWSSWFVVVMVVDDMVIVCGLQAKHILTHRDVGMGPYHDPD